MHKVFFLLAIAFMIPTFPLAQVVIERNTSASVESKCRSYGRIGSREYKECINASLGAENYALPYKESARIRADVSESLREQQNEYEKKADDKKCMEYGAKKGSTEYINCRMLLETQRQEDYARSQEINSRERQLRWRLDANEREMRQMGEIERNRNMLMNLPDWNLGGGNRSFNCQTTKTPWGTNTNCQ